MKLDGIELEYEVKLGWNDRVDGIEYFPRSLIRTYKHSEKSEEPESGGE